MTDKEALAAFMRKETLDDPTSRRLRALGWVLTQDVSEHNPEGRQELMAVELTREGRRAWESMLSDAKLIESVRRSRPENQNVMDYSLYVDD